MAKRRRKIPKSEKIRCRFCLQYKDPDKISNHKCKLKKEAMLYYHDWEREASDYDISKYPTFTAWDISAVTGVFGLQDYPGAPIETEEPKNGIVVSGLDADPGDKPIDGPGENEYPIEAEGQPLPEIPGDTDNSGFIRPPDIEEGVQNGEQLHIGKLVTDTLGVVDSFRMTLHDRAWSPVVGGINAIYNKTFDDKKKLSKEERKILCSAWYHTVGDPPWSKWLKVAGKGEHARHLIEAYPMVYGEDIISNIDKPVGKIRGLWNKMKKKRQEKRKEQEIENSPHDEVSQ